MIGRNRMTGVLRLLTEGPFATREESLDEVAALAIGDPSRLDDVEVFIVDLDMAVPVILMQVDRPTTWEAPGEPEPQAEPEVEQEPDDGLADALRRAAVSMEESGTVPPEPVSPFDALEESSAEDVPLVVTPIDEEVFIPKPVIMDGEWSAPVPDDAVHEPLGVVETIPVEVPDEEPVEESAPPVETVEVVAEPLDVEPAPSWAAAIIEEEPEPVVELSAEPVVEEALAEPAAPVEEPVGYSAQGSELSAYTCDDCVYCWTCPMRGQATPADCGSFQWKAV